MATTVANLKVLLIIVGLGITDLGNAPTGVLATDPDPVQDFCIADLTAAGPTVNGYACQDPAIVTTEDFAFSGLAKADNLTGNPTNGTATFGFVREWPALNTLGLGLASTLVESSWLIRTIWPPRSFSALRLNKGTLPAASINVLNGQSPGIQLMPVGLFGVGIDPELLAKSFFINETQVATLASVLSNFVTLSLTLKDDRVRLAKFCAWDFQIILFPSFSPNYNTVQTAALPWGKCRPLSFT
ncbi:unnamed protein product [Calypogeia fissa]